MRERKNIKLRVDMNDDTKFKIIDRKPERDLIYCIWIKLLLLAGKVNKEGELYLSRNIPYTLETLAIEFNRDVEQIKLSLDVFLELEMIKITEHNVYKVKNFAKHQNIKVKEKNKEVNNKETIENAIGAESQSVVKNIVGKDINDANVKIGTNESGGDKYNNKINKIRDNKFNEEVIISDTENLIKEDTENIKEKEQNETEQSGNNKKLENNLNDSKINKNQINDTRSVDKNILAVDKRKKSNSKRNNQIFRDGFQDVKEKYVSETFEGFGCFKEQEGDKVIMEFDVS